MKIVDLNVLLYVVNEDAVQHDALRSWWEAVLRNDEPIGLAWMVLLGFLRLSTNPRVFPRPLTAELASGRIDRWLTHPNIRMVLETEEHWRILGQLLDETGTAGNLTSDAHLAALAIAHGATLVSCDADFARYRQLRWMNPLSP
jgi:toxin-antitoxin system PIN domain toxin